jgi:undecaprenyl-diphosphatase
LWYADARASERSGIHALTLKQALLIGAAQALALIPGTSRSGITMTAGLLLGLTRVDAARFSFLLSIPIIMMAGGYNAMKLIEHAEPVVWQPLLLGILVSFIAAYLCIVYFMKIISRMGMLPFVIYRLALGTLLLVLLGYGLI